MNTVPEKSQFDLPKEFTIRHIELGNLKPALKLLNPKSGVPQQRLFARHIVTRWRTLGYDLQNHPAQNKSGTKTKRPHG